MVEKGCVWSKCETQALLEIWGEREIQRQLRSAVRNDLVFQTIASVLARLTVQRESKSIEEQVQTDRRQAQKECHRM